MTTLTPDMIERIAELDTIAQDLCRHVATADGHAFNATLEQVTVDDAPLLIWILSRNVVEACRLP